MTQQNTPGQNIATEQYVLTVNDYNLIQDHLRQINEILARSRVNGNGREDTVALGSEKLNDAVVKNLIGHTNVVYYNYETKAWNRSTYNGYPIDSQEKDTRRVHAFKVAMENRLEFDAQYEMAASVTMTIDRKFYPGWKNTISNPQYSNKGTSVVGNIIVKNKTTGKYELYCKSWVGVEAFFGPAGAVRLGAGAFAVHGARHSAFRATVLAAHTR